MSFKFKIGQHTIHKSEVGTILPTKLYIIGRGQMEQENGNVETMYLVSYVQRYGSNGTFIRSYIYEQEMDEWPETQTFTE